MPLEVRKRTSIEYKFKTYKDGKILNVERNYTIKTDVTNVQEAFPAHGDKK